MISLLKNTLITAKEKAFLFFFIFSIYVSSGISFGKIYLAHFCLALSLLGIYRNRTELYELFNQVWVKSILGFYSIVLITSVSAELNYTYLAYYLISFLIFLYLLSAHKEISLYWKEIVGLLLILVSVDVGIGMLEWASSFRYPISRLSSWNELFGRANFVALYPDCFNWKYLFSSPTGFHWNPNNYAFVLLLGMFYTIFLNKNWMKIVLRSLIPLMIITTGSRIGFYSAIILFVGIVLLEKKGKSIILPAIIFLFLLSDGFYLFPTQSEKVKEIALVSQSEFSGEFPEYCYKKKNSIDARTSILNDGIDLLKENYLIGQGAGSFTNGLSTLNEERGEERTISPHYFILELLVDFGGIILFPIAIILLSCYKRLKVFGYTIIPSLLLFLLAAIPMSMMQSSLVYFLPFYLFLFLIFIKFLSKPIES